MCSQIRKIIIKHDLKVHSCTSKESNSFSHSYAHMCNVSILMTRVIYYETVVDWDKYYIEIHCNLWIYESLLLFIFRLFHTYFELHIKNIFNSSSQYLPFDIFLFIIYLQQHWHTLSNLLLCKLLCIGPAC